MSRHLTPLLVSLILLSAATAAEPENTAGGKQPASAAESLPRFAPPHAYPEPTEAGRRIAAALEQPINVNWVDVQLGDIAVELENKYDLPVELDMAALTADGKGPETLINKSLRDVRLKDLLRSILDEQNLTFIVRYDQLIITTKYAVETMTHMRVYQVHDLVVAANDPTAAYPDFEHLIDLICSTIEPETWREAGGTLGEVKQFYGPGVVTLVVTQTEKVHKQIEELLAALRAAQVEPIREAQARLPRPTPPPADAPFVVGADVPQEKPQWRPVPASGAEVLARFPSPRIYPEPTEVERRIQTALDTKTDVAWLDTELNVVAQELAAKFKIPFRIDTPALAKEGKSGETIVNKQLKRISLRNVLKSTLKEHDLAFCVHDGAVLITTPPKSAQYMKVRTYQVFDLVVMPNDPTAARPDCEQLIELITSTIRPEAWLVNGGEQGECKEYVGAGIIGLVITQSEEVHEEIAELLAALRASRVTELAGAQSVNPPVEHPYYPDPIVFGAGYSLADHTGYLTGTKVAMPPEMTSLFRQLVNGKTEFACKLYRKLANNKSSENVVFSPYGASAALETLLLGARRKTAEEIRAVLNLPDDPSTFERLGRLHAWIDANKSVRGYQLMSRTRLLVGHDEPLLASFVGRAVATFDARIEPLDFTAGRTAALLPVLDAARTESGGFVGVQGLTDDVDEKTRLFLLNTTSFRGRWANPFSPSQTLREFFNAPTGKLNVEMMHAVGPAGYREADGIQIVRKEYAGLPGVSRSAFYVLLPSSAPGALAECERMLSQQKLARWLDEIEDRPVELHLPKFTFENQSDFRQALVDLGLSRSFSDDPETGADFSGINGSRTLRLQGVRQKARIEVNEEETHAVARTAAPVSYFGAGPAETELPKRVRCDRPFLFLIRDEHTGSILFMGRVAAPDNEPTAAVVESPPPKP